MKMVRTKDSNNKDRLLTLYLHYYYSLTFIRVEIKDRTYNKFRLKIKMMKTKLAE